VTAARARPSATAVRIAIHVQARAPRSAVVGPHGGATRIRLAAPPVDNAANEELVRFLAERLGLPRRQVRIVGGLTGRRKLVEIEGLAAAAIAAALAITPPPRPAD
jgi:uncharacterized protein (TIGR00251 family)